MIVLMETANATEKETESSVIGEMTAVTEVQAEIDTMIGREEIVKKSEIDRTSVPVAVIALRGTAEEDRFLTSWITAVVEVVEAFHPRPRGVLVIQVMLEKQTGIETQRFEKSLIFRASHFLDKPAFRIFCKLLCRSSGTVSYNFCSLYFSVSAAYETCRLQRSRRERTPRERSPPPREVRKKSPMKEVKEEKEKVKEKEKEEALASGSEEGEIEE
jgi:hypothetical protein